jgi:hypothetical protein
MLGLVFIFEDGGDMFLENVWLPPEYMVLLPRRLYSS